MTTETNDFLIENKSQINKELSLSKSTAKDWILFRRKKKSTKIFQEVKMQCLYLKGFSVKSFDSKTSNNQSKMFLVQLLG